MINKKIFISSLPSNCTNEDLIKFLEPYGDYIDLEYTPKKGTLNNNVANVTILDNDHYNSLMSKNLHFINGCKIELRRYVCGKNLIEVEKRIQNKRLYVKNLPHEATDDEVRELFSNFGEVELFYSCRFKRLENTPTNYGFVTFKDKKDAQTVLKKHTMYFQKYDRVVYVLPFKAKGKKNEINLKKEDFTYEVKNKKRSLTNRNPQESKLHEKKEPTNQKFEKGKRIVSKEKMIHRFSKRNKEEKDEILERRKESIKHFSTIFGVKEEKKSAMKLFESDYTCLWKVWQNHFKYNLRENMSSLHYFRMKVEKKQFY